MVAILKHGCHIVEYKPFRYTFFVIHTCIKCPNQSNMVKIKTKQPDIHWIPSLFPKNGKNDMPMFIGCFHGFGLTCHLQIRPQMKVNVLSFQMIYDVALCRLNF